MPCSTLERAVGVRHLDREGRRLDAGLLRVGRVIDLGGVAVALGPAEVHPHEHLREVGGVDATGLGADGHEGLADVVRAGEQGADLELADRLAQATSSASASASIEESLSDSASSYMTRDVVEAAAQALDALDLVLGVRERRVDGLRVLLVVPEVRGGGLLVEVGQLLAEPG